LKAERVNADYKEQHIRSNARGIMAYEMAKRLTAILAETIEITNNMKKENKLVIKLLDALAAKHSHMSFLYGFDVCANQHVIEVTPTESYKSEAVCVG
jgi:hypothetical protein